MSAIRVWQSLCLLGYAGVFILLISWYTLLAPSNALPTALILLLLVGPLLFPLRGLLHGRRYTYAWSLFLSLLYFTHGAVEAYSNTEAQLYGLLEVIFSVIWFIAGVLYVRAARREEQQGNR
ncbi:MAG: DUF2069 domain-containing protein [Gammaproteobacteria bacterium]|nr:DUF2069 domain-containing protein [Gammaproteobacteria bacterium]